MAEQQEAQSTQQRREVDKNEGETALAVGDHAIAPGQAGDNDKSQRDEADGSIGQYRIGRRTPARAGAVDEPEPHGVAANGRWQRLIKKRPDHVVAEGLQIRQRRLATLGNFPPSERAEKNLNHSDHHSNYNPADFDLAQAGLNGSEIDPAKLEIKQRQRHQY